jgi:hypothetical protein
MTTDLIVKLDPSGLRFTLFLILFQDDGAVGQIRVQTFEKIFVARHLDSYVMDWQGWRQASSEERETCLRLRAKRDCGAGECDGGGCLWAAVMGHMGPMEPMRLSGRNGLKERGLKEATQAGRRVP